MPLSGDDWAASISDALIADPNNSDLNEDEKSTLANAWKLVCNAHVTHITNNAEVDTTVSTTVTGTLPDGPVAANGSGTGEGTIS